MNNKVLSLTRWVILGVVIGLIGYDISITFNSTPNWIDSISGVMKRAGWRWPFIPFALSGLIAHFFLNWSGQVFRHKTIDYIILVLLHPLWWWVSEALRPHWGSSDAGVMLWMLSSILLGLASWMFLWPQRPDSKDPLYDA